ncbi:hypothetical protein GRI62_02230 [Erythrobacter arachoides]|uniref:Uncharacterized protein n=1 Tax=Aurantiacibacter arachoides TaxID=1850444 RepID=A0A844ZYV5_9SPHN|nr:hypothetical protein [Aurantiacibacter arachoides]MXO92422.1 hypothetical protein [Aurantiacibacter arachoides]GGD57291.1 hypothetical protein GCM10011411_16670 [Aurantiacibacter arachoides]
MRVFATRYLALFRITLLAAIAAVLLQATPSQPFVGNDSHGSAFDATTFEVAVLTQQREVGKATINADPLVPPPAVGEWVPVASEGIARFELPPRQTGPPPAALWSLTPPMRGPPLNT